MSNSENDQKWVAFELHDRLLPWIHGAKMQLANLVTAPGYEQQLEVAQKCLAFAAEEGRSLIGFLESPEAGTTEALEIAIGRFVAVVRPLAQQAGQQIHIVEPFAVGPDWSVRNTWPVQRIIEQSIMNAVQHAGECRIEIALRAEPGCYVFEIRDNGNGFEMSQVPTGHFGLSSIKERAASIQAELKIFSTVGQGTTVTLQVPR